MLLLRRCGGNGVASLYHLRRRGHGEDGTGELDWADGEHADMSDVWRAWQYYYARVQELPGEWSDFGSCNAEGPGPGRYRGRDEDPDIWRGARRGQGSAIGRHIRKGESQGRCRTHAGRGRPYPPVKNQLRRSVFGDGGRGADA